MGTVVAAASLAVAMVALAQQSAGPGGAIQESLRTPRKFVDLPYPPEALEARVMGFVVLELVLDDQGRVTSVQVLTGAPVLAEPAAANAREWVFEPQAGRTVLVDRFDIDNGLCNADTRSLFRLQSRTLATITACTGPNRGLGTRREPDDLHVLDMPRIEYPPIAHSARVRGTVVVRLAIAANGAVTSHIGHPSRRRSAFDRGRVEQRQGVEVRRDQGTRDDRRLRVHVHGSTQDGPAVHDDYAERNRVSALHPDKRLRLVHSCIGRAARPQSLTLAAGAGVRR